jgi:hypothetical protein
LGSTRIGTSSHSWSRGELDGDGRCVGVVSCVGSVECRGGGGGRRGRRTNLGMEDMAQIGGLVAGHGREAEVVNPTFI